MTLDVVDLRSFYNTPLGVCVQTMLGGTLRRLWPHTTGDSVAGLGYACPYLAPFQGEALRVLALMPARQGAVPWLAPSGANATALAEENELPLPSGSIDKMLLVHSLELAEQPAHLLDEVWRVLAPAGRLVLMVPNRRGSWSRNDHTPFGQGQPYSRRQLTATLRQALFSPLSWTEALYLPPTHIEWLLRSAPYWDKLGSALYLPFAGVHVVEATKQVYSALPVRKLRGAARLAPAIVVE